MYTLNDVFEQAKLDEGCGGLDGIGYEARIEHGIKILRDNLTKEISIQNTTSGRSYYSELSKQEYEIFKENGWTKGLYLVSLSNSRRKLDFVEQKIKKEINGKNNAKQIQRLKAARERYLQTYREVSIKLNKLNNG